MHMGTYKYYIVGVMALILVAAGAFYLLKGDTLTPASQEETPQGPAMVATSTYATTTYSIVYPNDFTVDPQYSNTSVNPQKPIAGVKFTIPLAMATGTNLSSDTYMSVEQLPRAKNCTGDIYLSANVTAIDETVNGISYSVAQSSDAGAGNLYEEMVYARASSNPCTAVRYVIHSTQIANYPEGTVRAFDRAALLASFDQIRDSLMLIQ